MSHRKRYSLQYGLQKVGKQMAFAVASIGVVFGGGLALSLAGIASADASNVNFENPPYTQGNINGQQGWSKTGGYDVAVVANTYGYPSFGSQSLRLSNSVTSGSFGDQTFAPSLSQPAGEPNALDKNGNPVASPLPHFESQFDIASTTQAEQPGMLMSVSPDNGAGARMSYLRFEDKSDGIHVYFDDVTDPSHGQNQDNFNESDIATLGYTTPHTIKFSMDFVPGPDNDLVKIYIDGNLAKVGTSWEDYYLFDTESNPGLANHDSRVVSTMLFRESGAPVAANAGKGYLVDNLSYVSGQTPQALPTSKDQCMNNGWKNYGTTFKNQGDCISFIATKGRNLPAGGLPQSPTKMATGNLTLSSPMQTLNFTATDNGPSASDTGNVTYSNPGVSLTYTAPLTCVNVFGKTAYFSYQIPADAPVAANVWVVWRVTDGATDTAGFTTAPDGNSAKAMCEAGDTTVTSYPIVTGDITIQ